MTAKKRGPSADECVMRNLIDRHAREIGDTVFIVYEDGSSWTYRQLREEVAGCAAGLQQQGIKQGDHVLVWLPNGPEAVRYVLAINYLGAVCVPINLSNRGLVLEHVINDSGASTMICDARLLDRLDDIEAERLETIILVGEEPQLQQQRFSFVPESEVLKPGAEPEPPARPIEPWDPEFVLYTSGTTGPAKGVISSYTHRHAHAWASTCIRVGDRRFIHGPLSHTAGAGAIYTTICKAGSIALVESFKTDQFWSRVRTMQPQVTSLLGATIPFLLKQPPSPEDKTHGLRAVIVAPIDENAIAFGERFGVEVYGIYSMTEMSIPMFCGPDIDRVGQCGTPRAGVQVKLVDEHDLEVEDGESGELVVRCDDPWVMMSGYLNNPAATAKVWQNGWFHTGDLFRKDPDGVYIFMDRMNDMVRRRGENISSFEVETAISQFPGVREVAIVGAQSEFSEDEVLAVICPIAGAEIDPAELIEFLRPRLPHFMVPRYIRIADDLPRTGTQKIIKAQLRSEGVTADTWDREKSGIKVKMERLN